MIYAYQESGRLQAVGSMLIHPINYGFSSMFRNRYIAILPGCGSLLAQLPLSWPKIRTIFFGSPSLGKTHLTRWCLSWYSAARSWAPGPAALGTALDDHWAQEFSNEFLDVGVGVPPMYATNFTIKAVSRSG